MNSRQIWLTIRLRWWLIPLVLGLVLIATFIVSWTMPKHYSASTQVILDLKTDPLLAALAPTLAAPAYMATQSEILQSERLSGRVVRLMGLAQSPAAVSQWRDETDAKIPLETYFGQLLQRGLIVKSGTGSQIMTIGFTGTDPNFAAAAANTFAKAYIDLSVELRAGPAKENQGFFDEQIKQLRKELETAQAKVADFQQSKGVVISADRFDQENARLASLETALAAASAEHASTTSVLRNTGSESSVDVSQSAAVQNLRTQLVSAEAKLTETSLTLGANHPVRIQAEAQVKELKEQLVRETRRVGNTSMNVNRVSSQKIGELQALVNEQKRTVLKMRAVRDEGAFLLKEQDAAQKAFESVNLRRSQLALESKADQAGARVLSPATAPLEPTSPNIPKNMLVAGILGTLLGIGAALAWERFDGRVRSEHDMISDVEVPVLSVLSQKKTNSPLVRRLPPHRITPQLTLSDRAV